MADVYKAKDHRLNRFVAVKVLKQEFKNDKAFVSKFRVEAQSAAGLSHANIVNVSSVAGLIADPGMAPYIGAKHAVSGLTRAAGIEYAAKGIRINAIAPGFTASEQTQHWIDNPEMCALVASYNYQNRIADPSEIANVALFLGSDLCSFMGGAIVPVDAGQTAH